jgi:hypothetical protein
MRELKHSCMQSSLRAGKRLSLILVFASVCWGAVLVDTGTAHAQHVQAGIIGGYGIATSDVSHDPYLFTIGAQAGITLPVFPLYLGARLMWFTGELNNARLETMMNTTALALSLNYLMYGVDVGFDVEAGPIVLRPLVSVGRATLSGKLISENGVFDRGSDSAVFVAPGVALLVNVCCLYVSGELRYSFLTEKDNPDGVVMLLGFGARI